MKIEHLEERINDYKISIESVVKKKILWKSKTKETILNTFNSIVGQYDIGWSVQQLNWMNTNEAVNITFDSFPPELIKKTNQIPSYQFIQGGALIFSQSYSGDVYVFILYPVAENMPLDDTSVDLGVYNPQEINEKLIVEKVDEFLKEITKWELPSLKNKIGF